MMFAKNFEYYTIILRGPFFRGHAVDKTNTVDVVGGSNGVCVCVCVCVGVG